MDFLSLKYKKFCMCRNGFFFKFKFQFLESLSFALHKSIYQNPRRKIETLFFILWNKIRKEKYLHQEPIPPKKKINMKFFLCRDLVRQVKGMCVQAGVIHLIIFIERVND